MAEELIGIIGGTGLGESLAENIKGAEYLSITTPFGKPSDKVMVGRIGNRPVAFINRHGRGHKLQPSDVPYAANIYALKKLSVHTIIATGAVGSLRKAIRPGELVIVDQFIDKTINRKPSFFADYGAVHAEMAEPVCARLNSTIAAAGKKLHFKTHKKGTYVCIEGPQFSTRAESLMHIKWGADLVGMTAMPEAKLAREAQMCYSLIALVSDYDCWRPQKRKDKQELLREIIGNMQKAGGNCLRMIEQVLAGDGELARADCACRRSLDLAVWVNKKEITASQKKNTAILFE